jgi:hypothetical protein
MAERDIRERDILVASNEYAYVQDLTKGDIVLYVGPTKISLSNTERLVEYKNDRFVPVGAADCTLGVSAFVSASSSQYIILENPPKDPTAKPLKGSNATVELVNGRKVVVPGPATFPLWPGQRAKVVAGHALREDEYLIVRVYEKVDGLPHAIGTELLIEGSAIGFYVPRTGLEVVPTERGYVRKAWRLKRGLGLHLRVIKPFAAKEGGAIPPGSYVAGQEILVKDREGFFFPSETVEIVGTVQSIPLGEREGIYVRHLETGRIGLVVGPCNYLPDPTREELVRRPLDAERQALYGLSRHDPERAVAVHVPPGFAVLVTGKKSRQVVVGPEIRILAHDEELEVLRLSTGTPKSDERLLATCFLQVEGNKISDVVRLRTADHVELEVRLAYRVSFVRKHGEPEKWFNVRNYVDLLCDHLRSLARAAARTVSIDRFHRDSAELLRSAILGEKKAEGPRAGRTFEENGAWVHDVEVLDATVLDADVLLLLAAAEERAIEAEVARRQEELRLESERLRASVDAQVADAQIAALAKAVELEGARRSVALATAESTAARARVERLGLAEAEAEALAVTGQARLALAEREAALERTQQDARVAAFEVQMRALAPELVATLKMLGNQQLAAALTKDLGPLAILGGESVAEVAERLLRSLPIGTGEAVQALLPRVSPGGSNGSAKRRTGD